MGIPQCLFLSSSLICTCVMFNVVILQCGLYCPLILRESNHRLISFKPRSIKFHYQNWSRNGTPKKPINSMQMNTGNLIPGSSPKVWLATRLTHFLWFQKAEVKLRWSCRCVIVCHHASSVTDHSKMRWSRVFIMWCLGIIMTLHQNGCQHGQQPRATFEQKPAFVALVQWSNCKAHKVCNSVIYKVSDYLRKI